MKLEVHISNEFFKQTDIFLNLLVAPVRSAFSLKKIQKKTPKTISKIIFK
jgi:hypothetical protein